MPESKCKICEEPGKFDLRIQTLEENYEELKTSLKEYKQDIYKRLDGFKNLLVVNLTAVVVMLVLLIINLIVIYGGRK